MTPEKVGNMTPVARLTPEEVEKEFDRITSGPATPNGEFDEVAKEELEKLIPPTPIADQHELIQGEQEAVEQVLANQPLPEERPLTHV